MIFKALDPPQSQVLILGERKEPLLLPAVGLQYVVNAIAVHAIVVVIVIVIDVDNDIVAIDNVDVTKKRGEILHLRGGHGKDMHAQVRSVISGRMVSARWVLSAVLFTKWLIPISKRIVKAYIMLIGSRLLLETKVET